MDQHPCIAQSGWSYKLKMKRVINPFSIRWRLLAMLMLKKSCRFHRVSAAIGHFDNNLLKLVHNFDPQIPKKIDAFQISFEKLCNMRK